MADDDKDTSTATDTSFFSGFQLEDLNIIDNLLGISSGTSGKGTTASTGVAESDTESEAKKDTATIGSILERILSEQVSQSDTDITGRSATRGTITDTAEKQSDVLSTGRQTSQLQIGQAGIDKIVGDLLGSESGIADIFSRQGAAGLYNSSVAAQASGDLIGNIVGEVAKVTGKTVTATEGAQATTESNLATQLQDLINTQRQNTATTGSQSDTTRTAKDFTEDTVATENLTQTQKQKETGTVAKTEDVDTEQDGIIKQIGNLLGF